MLVRVALGRQIKERQTFISGFFGQVFAWHIEDVPTYTVFIVCGLAVLVLPLVLLSWLARGRRSRSEWWHSLTKGNGQVTRSRAAARRRLRRRAVW